MPRDTHLRRRFGATITALATSAALAAPATAQVPATEADFAAYATGTVLHAEAVEQPELQDPTSTRVADADAAFSAAAVASTGLPPTVATVDGTGPRTHNEYGATVVPATTADERQVTGQAAYGRGYALDGSLEQEGQQQGQLTLAGLVEAVAPPPEDPEPAVIGPVPAEPLAYAAAASGDALALYDEELGACISLGGDIASGEGEAADVELLDQDQASDEETQDLEQPLVSTHAGERAVSRSFSHDFLAAQTDAEGNRVGDALALVAETRQTIAPVTLFGGTANELTIEFLGEWVLRAVATGVPGTARIHYGPAEASPSTPILRVITLDEEGNEQVEGQLTFQDLLGETGQVIDALPLVQLAIGEDPRAIGGDAESEPVIAADGTLAAAAVDVVRVKLLSEEGTGELAEIRIGHMEVSAKVPAGGITCEIPVAKSADREVVQPGETFTYTLTATNVFECPLVGGRFIDTIEVTDGVRYEVVGTTPEGTIDGNVITIGPYDPIPPGGKAVATIRVTVDEGSAAGVFTDTARFEATCEGGPVTAVTDVETSVALTGQTTIQEPEVGPGRAPAGERPDNLPTTGGGAAALGLAAIAASVAAIQRRRR